MTQTTARIKKMGKNFEIMVDMEAALRFKRGESSNVDFLEIDKVFSDSKKGFAAPSSDLQESFGTLDINKIASVIIKSGEILVTQEHRSAEQEAKFKQAVELISRNVIDAKTGNPIPLERIKTAIQEAGIVIKNIPIENQIKEILEKLSKVIPIKIQTKKVKMIIPAVHAGRAYGIISSHKEKENWLPNGDLEVVVNVPSGMIMDFYDKLNSITHGSALTEEMKE